MRAFAEQSGSQALSTQPAAREDGTKDAGDGTWAARNSLLTEVLVEFFFDPQR
jgi:hypothetical protein